MPRAGACGTATAGSAGMMTFLLILLALTSAGLITELLAAAAAPLGYQDESGFHFGCEHSLKADEFESGNPS